MKIAVPGTRRRGFLATPSKKTSSGSVSASSRFETIRRPRRQVVIAVNVTAAAASGLAPTVVDPNFQNSYVESYTRSIAKKNAVASRARAPLQPRTSRETPYARSVVTAIAMAIATP